MLPAVQRLDSTRILRRQDRSQLLCLPRRLCYFCWRQLRHPCRKHTETVRRHTHYAYGGIIEGPAGGVVGSAEDEHINKVA